MCAWKSYHGYGSVRVSTLNFFVDIYTVIQNKWAPVCRVCLAGYVIFLGELIWFVNHIPQDCFTDNLIVIHFQIYSYLAQICRGLGCYLLSARFHCWTDYKHSQKWTISHFDYKWFIFQSLQCMDHFRSLISCCSHRHEVLNNCFIRWGRLALVWIGAAKELWIH